MAFYSKYLQNLNIIHHCYPSLNHNHFPPSLLHSSPTRSQALHSCALCAPSSIFSIAARVNLKKCVSQIPPLRTLQWLHITLISSASLLLLRLYLSLLSLYLLWPNHAGLLLVAKQSLRFTQTVPAA